MSQVTTTLKTFAEHTLLERRRGYVFLKPC